MELSVASTFTIGADNDIAKNVRGNTEGVCVKINDSGQAVVEYVLTVVFVGLAALGTYSIFRYALARYWVRTVSLLSSFIP